MIVSHADYIASLANRISAGEPIHGALPADMAEARALLERLGVTAPVGAVGK